MGVKEGQQPFLVVLHVRLNITLTDLNSPAKLPQLLLGLLQDASCFAQSLPVPLYQLHHARLRDCDRRSDLPCRSKIDLTGVEASGSARPCSRFVSRMTVTL